jgi:hypothetical protein
VTLSLLYLKTLSSINAIVYWYKIEYSYHNSASCQLQLHFHSCFLRTIFDSPPLHFISIFRQQEFKPHIHHLNLNKGNAKRGISPRLKIWPVDLDLWPWKSIGFQIILRTKYVPSLVKIHWKMLILECSQGCYMGKIRSCDLDLWPWKSIGFQTLLRIKYVPSLVKIHWRMLILECSQGCYAVKKNWPGDLENQYPTNVHIFILGSCNVQSFMNFWLIL